MELLIKAGYTRDKRIAKGFQWLLNVRQRDGGWAIPVRAAGLKLDSATMGGEIVQANPSKPFSHLVTGVVLRAFAAHEQCRESPAAMSAGKLLISRFFQRDAYLDRSAPEFWTKFSYPFWFTDLLSSLDSLSRLGFGRHNEGVRQALEWFVAKQQPNGTWELNIVRGANKALPLWLTLAICRVVRSFCD